MKDKNAECLNIALEGEKPLPKGCWQRVLPWYALISLFFLICILVGFFTAYYISQLIIQLNL